jgi:F-type H+-transporting ATPase subunit delta
VTSEPPQPDSVLDRATEPLARVYAEALLGHLPADEEAEQVAAEIDGLVGLLDEIDGFDALLNAALMSQQQRCELVGRVFHGRVSEPLEGLLGVMAQENRLALLREVRGAFRAALHRRQGKIEVLVTTAVPLDDARRGHVAAVLAEALQAEPVVAYRVDAGLLGGMRIRVGDHLYDASVRAQLRKVQQRLAREIELPAGMRGEAPAPGAGKPPTE